MSTATVNRCLALRNATYPEPEWPDEIHRAAVRRAAAAGAVLVDVGCGRQASDLRVLAPSFERAYGVDVDLTPHREANWELVPADGHRLPFPDGAADVVAMNDVVEHLADPVAAFRDCSRVLRPGGRLIVLTVNVHFPIIYAARWLPHGVRQRLNALASNTPPEDTFPAFYRANTAPTLKAAGHAAGFELMAFRHVSTHPRYLMFSYPVYKLGVLIEQVIRRDDRFAGVRQFLHADFRKPR
jgi:ubiquinone/menaquinone biosynthesis C-methylase UbiE